MAAPTVHELAFLLALPSAHDLEHEAEIGQEIAEKLAREGACRARDVSVYLDPAVGSVIHGKATFPQRIQRERAHVVVHDHPSITLFSGLEPIQAKLEVEQPTSPGSHLSAISVGPLLDYIDSISLFNTFQSHGQIHSVALTSALNPETGLETRTGTVTFSQPSSSTSALAIDRSAVFDPFTALLCPNAGRPLESEDELEMEKWVRARWEDTVEVRIVRAGPGLGEVRVLVRCADPEEGEVRELDGMSAERLLLTGPAVPLEMTDLSAQLEPDLAAVDSSIRSTLTTAFQPSSPPRAPTPPPGLSPRREPTAERVLSPLAEPVEPPPRSEPRASWVPTMQVYPHPRVLLRQHRAGEPPVPATYSVCELPAGDADRRRDFMLAHGGQAWPDFSSDSFPSTKAAISDPRARQDRWDQDKPILQAVTTATKAAEVRELEERWARTDVLEPGWEPTELDQKAIEASLVDVSEGLDRQQTNDDYLLLGVRNREHPASPMPAKLLELAHFGIGKTPVASDPRRGR